LAPTVTILENTIGDIVWTRVGVGLYNGYLLGGFVNQNNNYLMINNPISSLSVVELKWGTIDDININTYDTTFVSTDGLLSFNTIEIRVYP
jgi:hypothetical protein